MTANKEKAIAALLAYPSIKAAAQAVGLTESTVRHYKKDPEFTAEYKRRCTAMLEAATNQAKAGLPPAIERLNTIVQDDNQPAQQQIAACRAMLEYSLRLIEATDFETRLQALETEMEK